MSRDRAGDDASTVLMAPRGPTSVTLPRYVLSVVEGPDRGQQFVVDGTQPSRTYLGKGPACHIKLGDPRVSRRHLALDVSGSRLRVTDLGSTNGTFVNGACVLDAYVTGGELVKIGETVLRVDAAAPSAVPLSGATRFGRIVGASLEMRRLYPLCERLAASDVPIVIEGETGTGKELMAEALHDASTRAAGPFVVFDCTTCAPSLVESALFGHERGAFTGAVATSKGVFEQADRGTLFIDEIGDLDVSLQPKLLRAIERSEIRRVGGDRWIKVDVRVVAATRRDLDKEVQAGRFRDDLFYRLAVARIELPPLRERHGDIALLTQYFWKMLGGGEEPVPYELLVRFEEMSWPGNVRELHNAVARRLALGELAASETWTAPDVPQSGRSVPPQAAYGQDDPIERVLAMELPLPRSRELLVDEFERRYVERVLARSGGDVARAAAASGIARRYFQLLRARMRQQGG